MQLEEKKVLLNNRFNVFKNRNCKEWWYTSIADAGQNMYLSICFVRIDLTDSLRIIAYHPDMGPAQSFTWKGYLDKTIKPGELYLSYKNEKMTISYTGSAETGWHFVLRATGWDIQLDIDAQTPPFTRYDNMFAYEYTLLHLFHNTVRGTVSSKDQQFEIKNGLAYFDHSFGSIPRATRWHWISLQNDEFALASLVNYGAFAQCYTQCYMKSPDRDNNLNTWIRLDRNVSFECNPQEKWDTPWVVTSADMTIELNIVERFHYLETVPPLLPFLIKVNHSECFVKAQGLVRINGSWVDTGPMYGVLEEHHGWW